MREPDSFASNLALIAQLARDVMSPRVETLEQVVSVRQMLRLLNQTAHHGFPVERRDGSLCGFILRRQLMVLLDSRAWELQSSLGGDPQSSVTADSLPTTIDRHAEFRDRFIGSYQFDLSLRVSENDLEREVDLGPFMDPGPPLVFGLSPLPHVCTSSDSSLPPLLSPILPTLSHHSSGAPCMAQITSSTRWALVTCL